MTACALVASSAGAGYPGRRSLLEFTEARCWRCRSRGTDTANEFELSSIVQPTRPIEEVPKFVSSNQSEASGLFPLDQAAASTIARLTGPGRGRADGQGVRRAGVGRPTDGRVVDVDVDLVAGLRRSIEHGAGLEEQRGADDLERSGIRSGNGQAVVAQPVVGHVDVCELNGVGGGDVLRQRRDDGRGSRRRWAGDPRLPRARRPRAAGG